MKYNQQGRRGRLLRVQELTPFEKDLLNQEILQDVRVKRIDFTGDMDERVFDQVEMEVFAEWGVMCPHPSISQNGHSCEVCGCAVFPADGPRRKVASK